MLWKRTPETPEFIKLSKKRKKKRSKKVCYNLTSMTTNCHLIHKENISEADLSTETLEHIERFTDESHLGRDLLKCKKCGQLYFFEFYEEIDWDKGNDPQYSTWIPVESEEKAKEMSVMTPIELLQFSPRIQKDFPSDAKEPSFKIVISEEQGDKK